MVNENRFAQHPTLEELSRWRRGEAAGDEVLTIGSHLASCDYCVSMATQRLGLDETGRAFSDDIAGEEAHPDVEEDLFAFVDGTAGREARIEIERHLAACASCRDTVNDLRTIAVPASEAAIRELRPAVRELRQGVRSWPLAIAASIAVIVMSVALWPRGTATPQVFDRTIAVRPAPPARTTTMPAGDSNPAWTLLVDGVRKGARIEMPDVLRSIRPDADVLRGSTEAGEVFKPTGTIVKSTRPELSWPAANDAQSVVQIFRGEEEVARSGVLTTSRWRPEHNLRRGITYTWQVRVTRNGETRILPGAPSPVAQFHVLDAATLAELGAAERDRAGDHLLLGILHARAGLPDEARRHLGRVSDPRDAEVARRVVRELDSWGVAE
jgi:hypothetical protein